MPVLSQRFLDLPKLGLHPLSLCLAPELEVGAVLLGAAVVCEPQEIERFRLSLAPVCSALGSVPAELDKAGFRTSTVMWCRSAVSFSFLFLVTAPRMRSCACDTASRLCVRTVLCSSAFLSVPLLPSTGSAAGCPALFAAFAGIISESDFFVPFIIGYGLRPSRCGPGTASQGGDEDIPVPAQEVCVHAEGLKTTRGGEGPCDDGPAPVAFCLPRRHRHPGLHCFRRSIPRLYVPLSTLRVLPHSSVPRMTRGQRGSLLLHCDGLAPSTSCRSPGAHRGRNGHC